MCIVWVQVQCLQKSKMSSKPNSQCSYEFLHLLTCLLQLQLYPIHFVFYICFNAIYFLDTITVKLLCKISWREHLKKETILEFIVPIYYRLYTCIFCSYKLYNIKLCACMCLCMCVSKYLE